MKIIAYVAVFFGFFISANSQTITTQLGNLNSFAVNSDDIFSVTLINPSTKEVEVNIQATWFLNNKKAVSLSVEKFTIRTGVNVMNQGDLNGVQKRYFDSYIEQSEKSTNSLPHGNYKVCLIMKCVTNDCSGAGSNIISTEKSDCFDISVYNPSPFLLSSPFNGATLYENRPNLTWIPASQNNSEINIAYRLTLVKRNSEKQSCADAIIRNRPILKEENITFPMLVYPSDLPDLDTGYYSWRVEAIANNNSVYATSETWCFSIKNKEELADSNVYVKLSTADYYTHHFKGDLYFIYNELYSAEKLNIQLFDQSGKEILTSQVFETAYGENKFILKVKDLGLKKTEVYQLKVKDQANKTYLLKFQIL